MVFKTIESSIDKSRTSLALFNKDWNIFKTNWQNTSGGFGAKFATIFNSNDINCLKEYNRQIQAGIKPSVAYKNTMMSCTKEAKKNAVAMTKGTMSYQQATDSIKNMSVGAKAGKVALQGLAMAGNMIAMWAITKVIELTVKAIDEYVNAWEHATEAIEEHSSAYKEAVSEIETVSSKIEDLDTQIAELNGLDPITNADDIEKLELEKKILEAQVELLEQKRDLEKEETNKAAEDYFNSKQYSNITPDISNSVPITGDPTADLGAQLGYYLVNGKMGTPTSSTLERVTPEEELQRAIDKIKEYQQEIDKLSPKEDAQEIADLEAKIIAVQTDANTLASTMLKNSESLTDASRKEDIVDLVTEYNNLTDGVNGYTDALNKNTSAQQENANKTGNLSTEELNENINTAFDSIKKSHSALQEFKEAMSNGMTESALDGVAGLSDELKVMVAEFHAGTVSADELYSALTEDYNTDLENYGKALIEKNQDNAEFYNRVGLNDSDFVNHMLKNYEVDLKNCKDYNQARAEIELKTIRTLGDMWSKYYNVQTDTYTSQLEALGNSAYGAARAGVADEDNEALQLYKQITGQVTNYRNAIKELENIAYNGIESSFEGIGGSSSSKSSSKTTFDWIETKISRIQRQITNFGKTVSATWLSWSTCNNALLSELSAVNEEILVQKKAYETYLSMKVWEHRVAFSYRCATMCNC